MLALTLAAELQGYSYLHPSLWRTDWHPSRVVDLVPVDTQENPFYYMFKIECTSCRNQHDSWVSISRHVRFVLSVSHRVSSAEAVAGISRAAKGQGSLQLHVEMQGVQSHLAFPPLSILSADCLVQREHTATISSGPYPYGSRDGPNKPAQILQVDCRGLELVDFKPEVSLPPENGCDKPEPDLARRASGLPRAPTLENPLSLSWRRASGTITMTRRAKRFTSRSWSSKSRGRNGRGFS